MRFAAPLYLLGFLLASSASAQVRSDPPFGVGQQPGSSTSDNANAGNVGEYISATIAVGSAISLTNGSPANITSISLTAGDWDVSGLIAHLPAATTAMQNLRSSVSLTSATLNTAPGNFVASGYGGTGLTPGISTTTHSISPIRISLSVTTTVYLVVNDDFLTSTMTAYGTIRARRIR